MPQHPPNPAPNTQETPAIHRWLTKSLQTVKARLKFPRKLRFTRDGKYFVLLSLGVGLAAINTANNLLYLILGMQLALIIVSGIMSEMSLRHLTVTRRLPTRAQAGRHHLVEIEIQNKKTKIPSYAIEVEDIRAGHATDKRCFFLKIGPKSTQIAAYSRKPHKRGIDLHTGFRIATRFPFGLFEKSLLLDAPNELIVYPATDPIHIHPTTHTHPNESNEHKQRGHGHDTIGLRPMRDGDDPRDIYWRKSTTNNNLIIKERAQETRPDASLTLDDIIPNHTDKNTWNNSFEQRIREAASKTVAHLRSGSDVKLTTTSGKSTSANSSTGSDPILRFLALISAIDEDSCTTKPNSPNPIPQPTTEA